MSEVLVATPALSPVQFVVARASDCMFAICGCQALGCKGGRADTRSFFFADGRVVEKQGLMTV